MIRTSTSVKLRYMDKDMRGWTLADPGYRPWHSGVSAQGAQIFTTVSVGPFVIIATSGIQVRVPGRRGATQYPKVGKPISYLASPSRVI